MTPTRRTMVTGGSGFLGSHFIRRALLVQAGAILNVDLLTYAGSSERVAEFESWPGYGFTRADVTDRAGVEWLLQKFRPNAVVHFAAESHVTRSERDAERFFHTNVEGTRVMLEAAAAAGVERFVHVSTDEVYGPISEGAFREEDKPPGEGRATSAYAKSKAIADDVACSYRGQLEVLVARPTNCFGPYQFPEKAFARWVTRALRGETVRVWGDGLYVRQWLHAEDLAEAILLLLRTPSPEPVYNVGPRHEPEIANLDLARWLVERLGMPPDRLVRTTYDRPDHDRRYAVDPSRIEGLGWQAGDVWEGLEATTRWYEANRDWWEPLVEEAESIYADEEPA